MNKHYNKIIFQGKKKSHSDSYFEGWYFKQVTDDSSISISFIPGVSYNKKNPHSFIQVIILNNEDEIFSYYFKYSIDDFFVEDDPFCVKIKDNIFRKDYIKININNEKCTLNGELFFSKLKSLNKSISNPNIMGILSYLPKMECNHHIVSVDHKVKGTIEFNDSLISFIEGKGYIEKDWGISFPKEYLWLQCNEFDYSKDIALTFSYATIPYLNMKFKGFFLTLMINDKEYRFASYNNSKLSKIEIHDKSFNIIVKKGNLSVEIRVTQDKYKELASPIKGEMINKIKEGLKGEVEIIFIDKKNNINISSKGKNAGIEIMMKNH